MHRITELLYWTTGTPYPTGRLKVPSHKNDRELMLAAKKLCLLDFSNR